VQYQASPVLRNATIEFNVQYQASPVRYELTCFNRPD